MPINKLEVKQAVGKVIQTAKGMGITVLPSAQIQIKRYCYRAQEGGLFESKHDVVLSAAALISAGVEKAGERRRRAKLLNVQDINEGYQAVFIGGSRIPQAGPGNHPPHRCFRRTVLTREHKLRGSIPLMDTLVIRSEEHLVTSSAE